MVVCFSANGYLFFFLETRNIGQILNSSLGASHYSLKTLASPNCALSKIFKKNTTFILWTLCDLRDPS